MGGGQAARIARIPARALSAITVTSVRRKTAVAAGKAVAFRPGQFCRARFAVFAACRAPVRSTRERTGALTMVNELE